MNKSFDELSKLYMTTLEEANKAGKGGKDLDGAKKKQPVKKADGQDKVPVEEDAADEESDEVDKKDTKKDAKKAPAKKDDKKPMKESTSPSFRDLVAQALNEADDDMSLDPSVGGGDPSADLEFGGEVGGGGSGVQSLLAQLRDVVEQLAAAVGGDEDPGDEAQVTDNLDEIPEESCDKGKKAPSAYKQWQGPKKSQVTGDAPGKEAGAAKVPTSDKTGKSKAPTSFKQYQNTGKGGNKVDGVNKVGNVGGDLL